MQMTFIVRHRKENLKKCSLRGLEARQDIKFFLYPNDPFSFIQGAVLLSLEGEELNEEDGARPLVLIDATWNYAKKMHDKIESLGPWIKRTLPGNLRTAYPRVQTGCVDPERGLASVEALYAAYKILKRPLNGILDNYYWKESFLLTNNFDII